MSVSAPFRVLLAVYTNRMDLRLMGCAVSDPGLGGLNPARVVFPVRGGEDYLLLVAGVDGSRGEIAVGATLAANPVPRASVLFGRLSARLLVPPADYVWSVGESLGEWQALMRVSVTNGVFEYQDPAIPQSPSRFFRLSPHH